MQERPTTLEEAKIFADKMREDGSVRRELFYNRKRDVEDEIKAVLEFYREKELEKSACECSQTTMDEIRSQKTMDEINNRMKEQADKLKEKQEAELKKQATEAGRKEEEKKKGKGKTET